MLMIDIIQTVASVLLSSAAIALAFMVYRIQRDRNTPKLMIIADEVTRDDKPVVTIRILNVGLVPAIKVRLSINVKEWEAGGRSEPEIQTVSDTFAILESQKSRLLEIPTRGDRSYIFTVTASCHNGIGDKAQHFQIGVPSWGAASNRIAMRRVQDYESGDEAAVNCSD